MIDYSRLPGDLQIEAVIQRLGYGSPCQPKVIAAKIAALRAKLAANEAASRAIAKELKRRG